MDWNGRVSNVRRLLDEHDADVLIITHLPHIRWLCGFTGSRALVLVTKESGYFLTDHRYRANVRRMDLDLAPYVVSGPFWGYIQEQHWLKQGSTVLFQPEYVSVADYESWHQAFEHIHWQGARSLLNGYVAIKSTEERRAIEKAHAITDQVFRYMLDFIKPGMTEREIALAIDYRHRELGAESMAFDTIVASGPNSALPHARPGTRILEPGDCVILDFGCVVDGMASDMTRTVFLGQPSDKMRIVYQIVHQAQESAISKAGPNVEARIVDQVARHVIDQAGYGEAFTHSTGHGLGYEVHEWPRVGQKSRDFLLEGSIVTIEPGIYLEGRFGIRIEDAVWIEEQGARPLPVSSRDLICL